MSVTERTREIGVRDALGATRRGILVRLLTVAVVLAFSIAGRTGLIVGVRPARLDPIEALRYE